MNNDADYNVSCKSPAGLVGSRDFMMDCTMQPLGTLAQLACMKGHFRALILILTSGQAPKTLQNGGECKQHSLLACMQASARAACPQLGLCLTLSSCQVSAEWHALLTSTSASGPGPVLLGLPANMSLQVTSIGQSMATACIRMQDLTHNDARSLASSFHRLPQS